MDADFRLADWHVRPNLNRLDGDDEQRRVSPKAMELLQALARRPGEVMSKDELIAEVWADGFPSDDALTTVIYELRRALGDDARQPRFVATIRKRGYRLIVHPESIEPSPSESRTSIVEEPAPIRRRLQLRPWGAVAALAVTFLVVMALAVTFLGVRVWLPWGGWEVGPESELPVANVAVMPMAAAEGSALGEEQLARQLTARLHNELEVGPMATGWQTASGPLSSSALADAVIDGQVQRKGDKLKIDVQLQDAATGLMLWGGSYERLDDGSGDLEVELAREIREQVEAYFARPRNEYGNQPGPTRVAEAFELGRRFFDRGSAEDHDLARAWFHLAVRLDPSFEPARAGLADSHVASAWEHYVEERYVEALDELAVARQLQPGYLPASLLTGDVLMAAGRSVEALLACQRALELAGDDQAQIEALAEIYQESGIEGVLRCLVERDRQPQSEVLDPTWLAALAARLGDASMAFEWLELAYREQRLDRLRFAIDPSFDALRHTNEYQNLVRRLALEA